MCHILDFEQHLKAVCASTIALVLETAVCDSDDPRKCLQVKEAKGMYDGSFNGMGCRPSPAAIERVLTSCGMNFKRIDKAELNTPDYTYDWQPKNNNFESIGQRRFWFASKSDEAIQEAARNESIVIQLPEINGYHNEPIALRASPKPPNSISKPSKNSKYTTEQIINAVYQPPPTSNTFIATKRRFAIVIPSYNNEAYCERNINSALDQDYDDFRIIFTDDASHDQTFNRVSDIVNRSGKAGKVSLIKNDSRQGALANLYTMIHSCADDEIVLTLDGDDWFPDVGVLKKLNQVYQNDVWITYGQYKNSHDGGCGVARQYSDSAIFNNTFRQAAWGASHLRTFYAWLFKRIRKEDLMYQGKFFQMTWDFAMMLPMLEMSGKHSQFLNDILYVYNLENPLNDHKIDKNLQHHLDKHIRGMTKYARTNPPPTTIGLMMIATGKYDRFVQGLISSADNNFFNNDYDITYYVFTDKELNINSNRKVVRLPIEHRAFPYASMDRFKHFTKYADQLNTQYLYYCDVDSLFVDKVGKELIGDLVSVQHCGYVGKQGSYEDNPNSMAYVDSSQYGQYMGGGFQGGKRKNYLAAAKWCYEAIEKDGSMGIIPKWHDESIWNRYCIDNLPNIVLTPSYHYPQSNLAHYQEIWGNKTFTPKILLLDKNHKEIRE